MKIAVVSNFDDEIFSEYFVAHGVSVWNSNAMCERLNAHPAAEFEQGIYKAVPDDYELKIWKP